jgi:hypothetical protein
MHSHLEFSTENMAVVSDEQDGMFLQDISQIEKMYSGKLSPNLLASLKRVTPTGENKREKEKVSVQ